MPKLQSYRVTLSLDEASLLKDIIHKGKHSAQTRKRAQALLLANDQVFDKDIAQTFACEKTPDGVHHWSLRLLQKRWATLENTDTKTVSHETIRKVLKKANSSLGKGGSGASRRKPTRNGHTEETMTPRESTGNSLRKTQK